MCFPYLALPEWASPPILVVSVFAARSWGRMPTPNHKHTNIVVQLAFLIKDLAAPPIQFPTTRQAIFKWYSDSPLTCVSCRSNMLCSRSSWVQITYCKSDIWGFPKMGCLQITHCFTIFQIPNKMNLSPPSGIV